MVVQRECGRGEAAMERGTNLQRKRYSVVRLHSCNATTM